MKNRISISSGRRRSQLWVAALAAAACMALAACGEIPAEAQPAPSPAAQMAKETPSPGSWEGVEALVSARRYPEAMAVLGKMDTEEARALLARLRYIVNGDYIACAGGTVAALTPQGGVALASYEGWLEKRDMLRAKGWRGMSAISLNDYGIAGIDRAGMRYYRGIFTPELLLAESDSPNQAIGRALEEMANWPPAYAFDADYPHSAVVLTTDGVYASYPANGRETHVGKLEGWTDIVDVRDGRSYALGLKADGTVLYHNFGTSDILDVSAWRDIVAIDAGFAAVGLKADGTVVCECNEYVKMEVSSWTDIIAVSTYEWCTLGLKADGTVVATGDNRYHQLDVSDWRDIVAIDIGPYLSIGLKADGTLVIAGDCSNITDLPLPDVSGMTGLYVPTALEGEAWNAVPSYDFDGDGLADSMRVETTPANTDELSLGNVKAKLIVTLASGKTLQKTMDGWWWDTRCTAGDFDADGKTDILLAMEVGGSNYGATGVFVYRVEEGELVRFPSDVLPNEDIKYSQQEHTRSLADASACIGASVLHKNGRDLLRLRMLNDYDPSAGNVNAWYLDTAWNGEGWRIEDMNLGEAYGEDKLIEIYAEAPPAAPDAALTHRPGFVEAELTVVGDKSVDIDAVEVDMTSQMQTLSLRQRAQLALRCLYDMTGLLVESCNIDTRYGLCLTMSENENDRSFFFAGVDPVIGYQSGMHIGWKQPGLESSPLDPADCLLPENADSMSTGELCLWFYENIGYQREVVRVEEIPNPRGVVDYVKLHLANGEFYEMYLSEAVGLPNGFYGTYPEGYSH